MLRLNDRSASRRSMDPFITDPRYGSDELRKLFQAQANAILCPSVGGKIERVAGDGDPSHSLDPHVVVCDELHVRKTSKQRGTGAH
jgi:hypothetical protein